MPSFMSQSEICCKAATSGAFVRTLGTNAIWLDYFTVRSVAA